MHGWSSLFKFEVFKTLIWIDVTKLIVWAVSGECPVLCYPESKSVAKMGDGAEEWWDA